MLGLQSDKNLVSQGTRLSVRISPNRMIETRWNLAQTSEISWSSSSLKIMQKNWQIICNLFLSNLRDSFNNVTKIIHLYRFLKFDLNLWFFFFRLFNAQVLSRISLINGGCHWLSVGVIFWHLRQIHDTTVFEGKVHAKKLLV